MDPKSIVGGHFGASDTCLTSVIEDLSQSVVSVNKKKLHRSFVGTMSREILL
jgi:hypothetical protein